MIKEAMARDLIKLSDAVCVDSNNVHNTVERTNRDKHNEIEEKFKIDTSSAFKQLLRSATLK